MGAQANKFCGDIMEQDQAMTVQCIMMCVTSIIIMEAPAVPVQRITPVCVRW